MKFYDCASAPSPRRVRIFLAEKGLTIPTIQVDLKNNEHLSDAFRKINPACTVPALLLDDGTVIYETVAVCRYLEEIHPEPPLLGIDAKDKAMVALWDHRAEIEGFLAVSEAFRNRARGLQGRAITGFENTPQIPELAQRGQMRISRFFDVLDERLGGEDCNPAGADSFPIVAFTWILAYQGGQGAEKAEAMRTFLTWALQDGPQATAAELGFVPIKGDVLQRALAEIEKIKE